MKLAVRLLQIAVLLALAFWLWTVFFPGPEKVIRKQLNHLAAAVSFSQNDGSLSKLAGMAEAANISDFFSTNVEVNVNIPGHEQHTFAGSDEITQAALLARQETSSLKVKFPDINITIASGQQSAVADVTVEVNTAGETDAIIQELKISFEKSDKHWLIDKIETVRTISQPALK